VHEDDQQQAHDVDQNVAFATLDIFSRVKPPFDAAFGGFDRLTVNEGRPRLGLAAGLFAHTFA
jgi:hypothetical protein